MTSPTRSLTLRIFSLRPTRLTKSPRFLDQIRMTPGRLVRWVLSVAKTPGATTRSRTSSPTGEATQTVSTSR